MSINVKDWFVILLFCPFGVVHSLVSQSIVDTTPVIERDECCPNKNFIEFSRLEDGPNPQLTFKKILVGKNGIYALVNESLEADPGKFTAGHIIKLDHEYNVIWHNTTTDINNNYTYQINDIVESKSSGLFAVGDGRSNNSFITYTSKYGNNGELLAIEHSTEQNQPQTMSAVLIHPNPELDDFPYYSIQQNCIWYGHYGRNLPNITMFNENCESHTTTANLNITGNNNIIGAVPTGAGDLILNDWAIKTSILFKYSANEDVDDNYSKIDSHYSTSRKTISLQRTSMDYYAAIVVSGSRLNYLSLLLIDEDLSNFVEIEIACDMQSLCTVKDGYDLALLGNKYILTSRFCNKSAVFSGILPPDPFSTADGLFLNNIAGYYFADSLDYRKALVASDSMLRMFHIMRQGEVDNDGESPVGFSLQGIGSDLNFPVNCFEEITDVEYHVKRYTFTDKWNTYKNHPKNIYWDVPTNFPNTSFQQDISTPYCSEDYLLCDSVVSISSNPQFRLSKQDIRCNETGSANYCTGNMRVRVVGPGVTNNFVSVEEEGYVSFSLVGYPQGGYHITTQCESGCTANLTFFIK